MQNALSRSIALFIACALFSSGCGSTKPAKFYALSPTEGAVAGKGAPLEDRIITVRLDPVDIPDYLDRPQIVSRSGQNELVVSEYNRWAGSLRDDITRALMNDLTVLLSREGVQVSIIRPAMPVDYRLRVDVVRFDIMPGGNVILRAQWILTGKDGAVAIPLRTSVVEEKIDGTGYAAKVAAMSRALEGLSREMAGAMGPLVQNKAH